MPALRGDLERIRSVLVAAGHAWTRPRAAVLHVLVGVALPLRVEEIHERLGFRAGRRGVNLSSVYRTVHLLEGLRVLRRVTFADGVQRYELAEGYRAHHHHFVCEACGRIEDVRRCPVEGLDLGVTVRSHHLELFGLCGECGRKGSGRVGV
jgi:Fe2+ or Zn2+ uptake regulation protein